MDEILEGANVQELADPVVTDNQVEEPVVPDGDAGTAEPETTEQVQSDEINSQFAAARRKAEEAYNRKMSGINREVKRLFGSVVNPVTGKNIETMEDYLQACEHQQRETLNQQLTEKGIDPNLIEQMVNNSPAIRQAQQILENNQRAEVQKQLDEDIKAVTAMAPEIKSLEDLEKHASYASVLEYVNKGLRLPDAFKLANFDSISTRQTAAAKQAAINQARSKGHLETTTSVSVGSNLADIPDKEISTWREYFPGLSDEELKKKYNQTL